MITRIEHDFRIAIPEALRSGLSVGGELVIRTDESGRIILIPKGRIQAVLQRTAGMWKERQDVPHSGVEYVAEMRRAERLRDLGIVGDGS